MSLIPKSPLPEEFAKKIENLVISFLGNIGNDEKDKIEKEAKFPSENHLLFSTVVEFFRDRLKIPEDATASFFVGRYRRRSFMVCPRPKRITVCRVILNLGNKESYSLSETSNRNKILRAAMLEESTCLYLGPASVSDFFVLTLSNPKYAIPSDGPSGPGISGSGKYTIRPRNYLRTTIVVDFEITQKMIDSLGEEGVKISASDPSSITEEIISKVGRSISSAVENSQSKTANAMKGMMSGANRSLKKYKKSKKKEKKPSKEEDSDSNSETEEIEKVRQLVEEDSDDEEILQKMRSFQN
jgi:hypothetical protein